MPIELLNNRPVEEGFHIIFLYINDITEGLFIKLFIVSVWVIVAMGIYFASKISSGRGDFSMGMAVAGFVVSVMTIILSLVPGLISGWVIGTVLAVGIISIIWFLSTKNE